MEAIATTPALLTAAEYLAWEAEQPERYEFYEGELRLMPGTSLAHNLVKGNLVAALRLPARQRGCRVYDESVKLADHEGSFYTYPDVLVSCDPTDRGPYLIRQPLLIAEVLSPATEDFDRHEKFARYQQLPSPRHFLLVAQNNWRVEWLQRDAAGQWIYTLLKGPEAALTIPDLGLDLPLPELYADTDVAPSSALPPVR